MVLDLNTSLREFPGVGPARAEKLAKALAPMGISVAAGSLHRKVCRLLGDR